MGRTANTGRAIGLDIGGTKLAGGLVDLGSGRVSARRIVPTQPQRGGQAVLADTIAMAQALLAEAAALGGSVVGIGAGVAELVDPAGRVTSAHTIAWQGIPVQERLAQLAPAVVESDVRAAALAEARYGAGRAFATFVYLTVGTGISSCLVQGGRPYAGARGNALVLSSGPLSFPCPRCGASVDFVLEEYASGPALVARYNRLRPQGAQRGEDVLAAAGGDANACQVVETAGQALGVATGWLVNVLDPEAVVVGGGLGLAGGPYWTAFVESARRHIWADSTRDLPILPATTGTDAGIIGAAASVVGNQ